MSYFAATKELTTSLTSLDLLYISLVVAVILLSIVIVVAVIQLILVLRDVRKVTDTVGDLTENLHNIVVTPVSVVSRIVETVGPHIEGIVEAQMEKLKKKKKKK